MTASSENCRRERVAKCMRALRHVGCAMEFQHSLRPISLGRIEFAVASPEKVFGTRRNKTSEGVHRYRGKLCMIRRVSFPRVEKDLAIRHCTSFQTDDIADP